MSESIGLPEFKPFDSEGEMKAYKRNLPHWRQPGATYFVTFRQADSIPLAVLAEWLDIRDRWYRAHGLDPRWRQSDSERFAAGYATIPKEVRRAFEREQAKMIHEELDRCQGSCLLRHQTPRSHVASAMRYFHGERAWVGDFIIMPNHVHALLIPFDGWELEDLLGSIKRWSSRHIGKWLEKQPESFCPEDTPRNKHRFWQHESYDRIVRDFDELTRFRNYIADNGSKANLSTEQYFHHVADWLHRNSAT